MFASLRRHPIPIEAFFRYSLVMTYAFPQSILQPLLPPGLILDTYDDSAFLAIALVQTERLRAAGLPAILGRSFFLSGYRIFTRYQQQDGKELRGLLILRSDADSPFMVWSGNVLTNYRFSNCVMKSTHTEEALEIHVTTPKADADLSVRACLDRAVDTPPSGSPFPDLKTARRYAGPLPFTFDYEQESGQIVIVKGIRENWKPRAVHVEVERCTFLEKPPFNSVSPRLANAFFVENIHYRWESGIVVSVPTHSD